MSTCTVCGQEDGELVELAPDLWVHEDCAAEAAQAVERSRADEITPTR